MRVLIVGWPSFLHGEATAGDVLAMEAVREELARAGMPSDTAWSPVMRPDGMRLAEADPARYTHVVFVCGPVHGEQVRDLHGRFRDCHRIAVGVSVIDPSDPAVTGFHEVLPRDGGGAAPRRDLAAGPAASPEDVSVPVAAMVLAPGQREYAERRRHEEVTRDLEDWMNDLDCAPIQLDTRLDPRDWRLCSTAAQVEAILRRADVVITTRLHGLVLGLRNGVPVVAVDPVAGGAKVTAQAAAWDWPAVITPAPGPAASPAASPVAGAGLALSRRELDRAWRWCLSADGRAAARARSADSGRPTLIGDLLRVLRVFVA